MNVYKDAQEKEFKLDPKAIKMGTKWVVTDKDTHEAHNQCLVRGKRVRRRHQGWGCLQER